MQQTFDQFKLSFYARVADLSLFDCLEFNALKIVLDGLKVNYSGKGIQNHTIFQSLWQLKMRTLLQRVKHFSKYRRAKMAIAGLRSGTKAYLLFDNGRVASSREDKPVSFYFEKIKQELGEAHYAIVYQKPVVFKDGLVFQDLEAIRYAPLSRDDKELKSALRGLYHRIDRQKCFSPEELKNIATAFGLFFEQYRIWKRLLEGAGFKASFFEQHYHREGMLLALKRLGIQAVELQHGLIAKEDIFYIFPKQVAAIAHKALFPDKILTYSKYWSDILASGSEFRKDQIEVIGQYQYINTHISKQQEEEYLSFVSGRPFILITTQTFLHEYFIDYVSWLSSDLQLRHADHVIVVKLHPSEKRQSYEAILHLPNVKILDCNTEFLLSRCTHHVSIYSTTLYDGSKYECENYSLNIGRCRDYVEALVNSGVSRLLEPDENPLDQPQGKTSKAGFYESFDLYKSKLKGEQTVVF